MYTDLFSFIKYIVIDFTKFKYINTNEIKNIMDTLDKDQCILEFTELTDFINTRNAYNMKKIYENEQSDINANNLLEAVSIGTATRNELLDLYKNHYLEIIYYRLFNLPYFAHIAGKIVGMFNEELDLKTIKDISTDNKIYARWIQEAVDVLREAQKNNLNIYC
jgi:hypothetical protein